MMCKIELQCVSCFASYLPVELFAIDPDNVLVPYEAAVEAYAERFPGAIEEDPLDPLGESVEWAMKRAQPICLRCAKEMANDPERDEDEL